MIKNNKGVTLSALVITIIVILILSGITITTSNSLIKDTKAKNVLSNMYLVKGKLETIYEDYQFSDQESVLTSAGTNTPGIATKVNNISTLSQYGVTSDGLGESDTTDKYWYEWDGEAITALGFDENMLPNSSAKYIVNYVTGEIIYTPGIKNNSGEIIYTYTAISNYIRGNS